MYYYRPHVLVGLDTVAPTMIIAPSKSRKCGKLKPTSIRSWSLVMWLFTNCFTVVFIFVCNGKLASSELSRCTTDGVTVVQITKPLIHAEGPHWEPRKQQLFFVDIANQTIHRFDPVNASVTSARIDGGAVSPIIAARRRHWFFIGRGVDLVLLRWDGVKSEPSDMQIITSVDSDKAQNRFNDGKADSSGRMWIGTMGPEDPVLKPYQGSLYSFSRENNFTPKRHLSSVSVSNGLGWNTNDTLMYYIDSISRNIDVFDFDLQRGSIRNRRVAFSLDKYEIPGVPDGLTVDSNDNLWIAVYGGGAVLHVDPRTSTLLRIVRLPVSRVTSCSFGGPSLNILYVTSSRRDLKNEQLAAEPLAGSVFALYGLQVKGQRKTNTANNIKTLKKYSLR